MAGVILFDFRVIRRIRPVSSELDLAYILLAVTFLAWLWTRPGRFPRAAAAVLAAGAFVTSIGFVRHAWAQPTGAPDYQSRVEYRVQDWVWKNLPDARVYADGSVRFWYNAWHDLAQMAEARTRDC